MNHALLQVSPSLDDRSCSMFAVVSSFVAGVAVVRVSTWRQAKTTRDHDGVLGTL